MCKLLINLFIRNTKKILCNVNYLFNKRIYSLFNLCVKFIKLRDTLQQILTTANIYSKANKYQEIFKSFMQLGFIMQANNLQEISDANQFPDSEVCNNNIY